MYEVMARRYRPASFGDVVGQEHIAATLKNAISRDRVAHAYIFTGGHGCGKTTMARILAKALVCEKGPTQDPCGVCPICTDVAAGRDSDVLEIDGASNNGIEQIRQLREQAAYVPTRARFKIYIIDEVHMLSDGAFNALLKTLEEPPRHVKFILATTDPHKVPDTILSRCQRFDFRLVPAPKLAAFFRRLAGEENAAITDDALDAVAAFAEGSVRDGLVLLDQLLSFADGEVTREDVESVRGVASAENVAGIFAAISRQDVAGALAIVDNVAARGTNVGDFLDQLITFGRDLMLLAAGGNNEGIAAYGPARETLLALANHTSLESALLYLDVLTQARTRVRMRALTNPLVALEMAIARLAGLGGVTPVSEILARLNQLPLESQTNVSPAIQPPQREISPTLPAGEPEPPPSVSSASEPQPAAMPEVQETAEPAEPTAPWEEQPGAEILEDVSDKPESRPAASNDEWAYESSGEQPPPEESNAAVSQPPAADAATMDAGAPLTTETVSAQWNEVLDRLAEAHPADHRYLARITFEGVENGTINLKGPPTAVEAWDDRRRIARLAEAATGVFGQTPRFSFTETLPARAAVRTEDDAKHKLTRHPAVDKIKSLFEGVVVDCRPNLSTLENEEEENEGDAE